MHYITDILSLDNQPSDGALHRIDITFVPGLESKQI